MNARSTRMMTTALLLLTATSAAAQDFSINWYTVDGGGEMFTTGGSFELSGTVAQPDAGAMTGGDFELVGGFWPGAAGGTCDACDMNCDGDVNAIDIEPFLDLLFGGGEPCDTCTGDVNGDGSIDALDIEPFLDCLFSP